MTVPRKLINAYIYTPELVATVAESAESRLLVRTPYGAANFFVVGDSLEARVSEQQAIYLANIEGYEVEGYPVKQPQAPKVDSWIKEGERLAKAKISEEKPADPMQTLLAMLGGPEALMAMLANQAGNIFKAAEVDVETKRAEAAAKIQAQREAQGWTHGKLEAFVDEEQATVLLAEFDRSYTTGDKPLSAVLAHLARIANENHVLSDKLTKLQKEA